MRKTYACAFCLAVLLLHHVRGMESSQPPNLDGQDQGWQGHGSWQDHGWQGHGSWQDHGEWHHGGWRDHGGWYHGGWQGWSSGWSDASWEHIDPTELQPPPLTKQENMKLRSRRRSISTGSCCLKRAKKNQAAPAQATYHLRLPKGHLPPVVDRCPLLLLRVVTRLPATGGGNTLPAVTRLPAAGREEVQTQTHQTSLYGSSGHLRTISNHHATVAANLPAGSYRSTMTRLLIHLRTASR